MNVFGFNGFIGRNNKDEIVFGKRSGKNYGLGINGFYDYYVFYGWVQYFIVWFYGNGISSNLVVWNNKRFGYFSQF